MRQTEPLQYLPFMGISPIQHNECAMPGCSNTFQVTDGVAFEGKNNGVVHIYFFCSFECYLDGLPVECCGHG